MNKKNILEYSKPRLITYDSVEKLTKLYNTGSEDDMGRYTP